MDPIHKRLNEIIKDKNAPTSSITMTFEDTIAYQSARDPQINQLSEDYFSEGVKLAIDVSLPNKDFFPGKRPGVLFFFGGGFKVGCKEAFAPQAEELTKQGYVTLCVNYRIAALHGTNPDASIRDGVAAWKYMHDNSSRWNLDINRLAIAGGSAGGLIALMCGMISGIQPQALALFNPAIIDPRVPALSTMTGMTVSGIPVATLDSLKAGMPPMLIQHGESDSIIPLTLMEDFSARAHQLGIDCRLITYPNMSHGFFNFNRSRAHFHMTLGQMMFFLDETIGDRTIMLNNNLAIP